MSSRLLALFGFTWLFGALPFAQQDEREEYAVYSAIIRQYSLCAGQRGSSSSRLPSEHATMGRAWCVHRVGSAAAGAEESRYVCPRFARPCHWNSRGGRDRKNRRSPGTAAWDSGSSCRRPGRGSHRQRGRGIAKGRLPRCRGGRAPSAGPKHERGSIRKSDYRRRSRDALRSANVGALAPHRGPRRSSSTLRRHQADSNPRIKKFVPRGEIE
jgi:hypothetical protein